MTIILLRVNGHPYSQFCRLHVFSTPNPHIFFTTYFYLIRSLLSAGFFPNTMHSKGFWLHSQTCVVHHVSLLLFIISKMSGLQKNNSSPLFVFILRALMLLSFISVHKSSSPRLSVFFVYTFHNSHVSAPYVIKTGCNNVYYCTFKYWTVQYLFPIYAIQDFGKQEKAVECCGPGTRGIPSALLAIFGPVSVNLLANRKK